uniref:Uncharacterized protein n=1 Tax=Magallana gigas TaxID=29159 RepID=K1QNW3_MAGGI
MLAYKYPVVSKWANNQKLRLRMTDDFNPPSTCADGRCRDMSDDFIYIVIVPAFIVVVFAVVLGVLIFRRRTKRTEPPEDTGIFGNCPITETPCYRPVEVAPCPMWIQKDPKEGHDLLEAPPILHPPPYREIEDQSPLMRESHPHPLTGNCSLDISQGTVNQTGHKFF